MDNEYTRKSLVLEVMHNFIAIFTLSSLAISCAGLLAVRFNPDEQFISGLFPSVVIDSFYNTILQIAGFSFIVAILGVLLMSERFIAKMRFWLRFLLMSLSALLTFSVFAVVFKWFPVDNPQTWLGFILCTIVCCTFSFGITLLRFKLEGKKYDKLLANYKTRHNDAQNKQK